MKYIRISFFLIFILLYSSSCTSDNQTFDIKHKSFYHFDEPKSETIQTITEVSFSPLTNKNLGYKNGVYWFKVILNPNSLSDSIVFNIESSPIKDIKIYNSETALAYKDISKTHRSLLISNYRNNNTFFLKATFEKQVYFKLHLKKYDISQVDEKYIFFSNGMYYGFVLMVIIVNVFFYFSLKHRTFLAYSFFLIAITLTISIYDGVINLVFKNSVLFYLDFFIHFLVAYSGAIFANYFLNLSYHKPQAKKIGVFFLSAILFSYFLFIVTNKNIFISIGDSLSLITLVYYWILGVVIYKKNQFAKFFVIGYTFILFSSIYFLTPINWGINIPEVSLNTIKLASLFEMLILSYAITYRIRILHQENKKRKKEIKTYLQKIHELQSHDKINIKPTILKEKYNLSEREIEVLFLIFEGHTNKKIAESLCISYNTVKYHIRNIYEKIGISSKGEVIDLFSQIKKS